jgi:hypothetical protein
MGTNLSFGWNKQQSAVMGANHHQWSEGGINMMAGGYKSLVQGEKGASI